MENLGPRVFVDRASGVDALIEALASRFGWPEVDFVRRDQGVGVRSLAG